MKVYHTSPVIVDSPDTLHSRNYLDLGRGFYPTTLKTQAVKKDEKISRIIAAISDLYAISIDEEVELFYNSETSQLIIDGVADLHCRSSKYLAELIWEERHENK